MPHVSPGHSLDQPPEGENCLAAASSASAATLPQTAGNLPGSHADHSSGANAHWQRGGQRSPRLDVLAHAEAAHRNQCQEKRLSQAWTGLALALEPAESQHLDVLAHEETVDGGQRLEDGGQLLQGRRQRQRHHRRSLKRCRTDTVWLQQRNSDKGFPGDLLMLKGSVPIMAGKPGLASTR